MSGQETMIIARCFPVPSAAHYCGISPSNFRALAKKIGLPVVRIGGRVLFDRHDLDLLIDCLKEAPNDFLEAVSSPERAHGTIASPSNRRQNREAADLALDAFARLA